MKKHLIAAAVAAAVAAPAMAQNVELYGVMDLGYSQTKTQNVNAANELSTDAAAEGQLSGNRIGFRGTEDLGGGLKAGFVYEIGVNPAGTNLTDQTTANTLLNRQSYLSLTGSFGDVRIGRQQAFTKLLYDGKVFGGSTFAFGDTTAAARSTVLTGTANPLGNISSERLTGVQYMTPNFSGFTAGIQVIRDKSDNSTTAGELRAADGEQFMLDYVSGPIRVAAAVKRNEVKATEDNNSTQKQQQTSLLATYDFKVAKVFLGRNEASLRAEAATLKQEFEDYSIGVSVPVGAAVLKAQYSDGQYESAASPSVKTDLQGYQFGVEYSLSKRTTAYGMYGSDEAKRTAATNGERSAFVLGLRHTF